MTTTQPVYPLSDMFGGFIPQTVNTPEIFNTGFSAAKCTPSGWPARSRSTSTTRPRRPSSLVPNDKWWGDKPVLDKVIFRQLEASAEIAAFKNGEIDMADGRTLTKYKQLEGSKTPRSAAASASSLAA